MNGGGNPPPSDRRHFRGSLVGGFVAGVLISLTTLSALFLEEPIAIIGLLFVGVAGAIGALIVTTLPALLLGGLLGRLQIRHPIAWIGIGALAGVGCYLLAGQFPGVIGEAVTSHVDAGPPPVFGAAAIAGIAAALFFRTLADLFLDLDSPETASLP